MDAQLGQKWQTERLEQNMTSYFDVSNEDKYSILEIANEKLSKNPEVIEKDIWLTGSLYWIFSSPWADCFSFNGGSALTKAYNLVDRFSEDVDIIFDVRKLIPEEIIKNGIIPKNRTGADKRNKNVRHALNSLIDNEFIPYLNKRSTNIEGIKIQTETREKSEKQPKDIIIEYPTLIPKRIGRYIDNKIRIEFRGITTGEPKTSIPVTSICDGIINGIEFPRINVKAIDCYKILFDKMMIMHLECIKDEITTMKTKDRYSRHWFDVSQMLELTKSSKFKEFAKQNLKQIIQLEDMFFPKYLTLESGKKIEITSQKFEEYNINLIPSTDSQLLAALRHDYQIMVNSGMLYGGNPPSFEEVLKKCNQVSENYNSLRKKDDKMKQ
jgi:hypothetical protein